MNAPPDQQLLETIAIDLGVDPSFVEKDWHAMRLVAVLAGVEHGDLRPVFSGGTSLSKAYGLGVRSCVAHVSALGGNRPSNRRNTGKIEWCG